MKYSCWTNCTGICVSILNYVFLSFLLNMSLQRTHPVSSSIFLREFTTFFVHSFSHTRSKRARTRMKDIVLLCEKLVINSVTVYLSFARTYSCIHNKKYTDIACIRTQENSHPTIHIVKRIYFSEKIFPIAIAGLLLVSCGPWFFLLFTFLHRNYSLSKFIRSRVRMRQSSKLFGKGNRDEESKLHNLKISCIVYKTTFGQSWHFRATFIPFSFAWNR